MKSLRPARLPRSLRVFRDALADAVHGVVASGGNVVQAASQSSSASALDAQADDPAKPRLRQLWRETVRGLPLRAALAALLYALICALLTACASTGTEQMGLPAGAPVRLNSTVPQVQQVLGVTVPPGRDAGGELTLPLDARGIQVFFDKTDLVRGVRLRAPFDQPVMGIRIGDAGADVLARLGKPSAQARAAGQTGYTYHPDQITLLTYLVGGDGRVDTIFMVR